MKNILLIVLLFGLSCCSGSKIKNGYYVEMSEEGDPLYYVEKNGHDSPGGVFDGVVKEIIWDRDEIIAKVKRLSSSDSSGWYKLDLNTGKVVGPMSEHDKYELKCVKIEDFYKDPRRYRK